MTAFPKIVGNFLQEDIFQYKDNIDDLTEKLLLLKNVDFELSQKNKLVVNMKSHTSSSRPYLQCLYSIHIVINRCSSAGAVLVNIISNLTTSS